MAPLLALVATLAPLGPPTPIAPLAQTPRHAASPAIASAAAAAGGAAAAPVVPQRPCRLLSFSGGGSWGAFEAGVLSRLVEERTAHTPGWDVDGLLGVSAGALNAGLLATHARGAAGLRAGADRLKALWSETRTRDVWTLGGPIDAAEPRPASQPVALPRALLSTRPLGELLSRALAGRELSRNLSIGLTNLASGQPVVADERVLGGAAGAHHAAADAAASRAAALHTHLMASCAIPFLFPPVTVNKSLHIDGGVSHNVLTYHGLQRYCPDRLAPVELEIIDAMPRARALTPEQSQRLGVLEIAVRTAQLLLATAADHQLSARCAPGVASAVRARVHSPSAALGLPTSMLDFDHGARMWRAGYEGGVVEEFDFCPPDAEPGPQRQGRPA